MLTKSTLPFTYSLIHYHKIKSSKVFILSVDVMLKKYLKDGTAVKGV